MQQAIDALSENIQSLGRFAQMEDFRRHTGEGFVSGLMELYSSQVRALGELRKTLQTPSATNEGLSVGSHLECLRQDLQSFYGVEASLPGLFAGHIDGAEQVARSLEQENAELRAALCRERWDDISQDEARKELGCVCVEKAAAWAYRATRAWGVGATSDLGRDD